ncbi:MAG: amidinotransferase [Planctomycetes bacterium]|nr:amidinotransferase [Planctomycetota bacterium]
MTELAVEVQRADQASPVACPVNSYNSWDPLEEVIVGRIDGSTVPPHHVAVTFNIPRKAAFLLRFFGGRRYPWFLTRRAQAQLDGFVRVLEAEGVRVRRPDAAPLHRRFSSPDWSSRGFSLACPRDGFIVIGDEIIETPMAWRCRYFEANAYRALFKEYFRRGARWTAAPRPELTDALYVHDYSTPAEGEPMRYVITEFEPVFDAADFVRCGRDIFVQRSNVTNAFGIEWMRRHLGDRFRIHEIETTCRTPMHIDSTFMPLAPGKLLINPAYIQVDRLPKMFRSWDVIVAPQPEPIPGMAFEYCSMTSLWISLNVLMLDERRVIVERSQRGMIETLRQHGFEPIPVPFAEYLPFGGSFHCATLDVRRRGGLQSYF